LQNRCKTGQRATTNGDGCGFTTAQKTAAALTRSARGALCWTIEHDVMPVDPNHRRFGRSYIWGADIDRSPYRGRDSVEGVLRPVSIVALIAVVSASGARLPTIRGGTPAQRETLREVAVGFGRGDLSSLKVLAARRQQWPAGAVALSAKGQGSRRAQWQAQVTVDAFQHRSVVMGLAPVVALHWRSNVTSLWGSRGWRPAAKPIHLPANASAEARSEILRAARNARVPVARVVIRHPYGLAAEVTVQARHPSALLAGRGLCSFRSSAALSRLVGYYLEVRHGSRVLAVDSAAHGLGLDSYGSWLKRGLTSACLTTPTTPAP
jgi:hypothetical protein